MRFTLLIGASVAYGFLVAGKYQVVQLPEILNNYGADFFCMPVMLSLALIIVRKIKRQPQLFFHGGHTLACTIYVALCFEFLLPKLSNKFTPDSYDVLAYVGGAVVYGVFQRKWVPLSINQKSNDSES